MGGRNKIKKKTAKKKNETKNKTIWISMAVKKKGLMRKRNIRLDGTLHYLDSMRLYWNR